MFWRCAFVSRDKPKWNYNYLIKIVIFVNFLSEITKPPLDWIHKRPLTIQYSFPMYLIALECCLEYFMSGPNTNILAWISKKYKFLYCIHKKYLSSRATSI